jgi:hypothetical protein
VSGGSLPGVGNANPFAYRIGGGGLGIGAATETGTTAPIVFYCGAGGVEQYRIAPLGVNTWSDGAGGTRMTLNSTGLGIGASPNAKLQVSNGASVDSGLFTGLIIGGSGSGSARTASFIKDTTTPYNLIVSVQDFTGGTTGSFIVRNGSTDQFRIDSSGNVGAGIAPSAWATTTTIWRALDMQYSCGIASTGAGSGEIDFLWNAYYDQTDQRWEFKYTGDRASRYSIGGAGVHTWYNTASTGTANNPITWNPAMTLDASGRLLIGKTASALSTVGLEEAAGGFIQSTVTSDASLFCNRLATDGETIKFYRQTLQVGNISVTTTATAYNTSSDYRLKESVQPLVGGLTRVNALKPSVYNWKSDGSAGEGFLAHELADIVPAAVTGEKDAVNADGSIKSQGIDMSRIVPILVAAIQELTARVQTLEAR